MTVTDVLAVIGAITGIIGMILASGALLWDWYKWKFSETVKLRVTASPNFVTNTNPNQDMIWVNITNVGRLTTKILNISLQGFDNKPGKKQRHGEKLAVVTNLLYGPPLPVLLPPGEVWGAGIRQDTPDIAEFSKYSYFVVSIEDSVSEWPWRAEVNKNALMKPRK